MAAAKKVKMGAEHVVREAEVMPMPEADPPDDEIAPLTLLSSPL